MKIMFYDDRASWLAARRGTIGGSDVPVILGLSRYSSPLELWSRKKGLIPDSDLVTPRMKIGAALEPALLEMLADEAGVFVEPTSYAIVAHDAIPEFAYSPDGFVLAIEDGRKGNILGLAEVKNRAGFGAADEWAESVPPDVNAQAQHGLDCSGLPFAWVGALIMGGEFRWQKVARDDVWIAEARPRLLDFARRLREDDPPPPTGSEGDRAALTAIYPRESSAKTIALPGEFLDLAWQLDEAQDTAEKAKDAVETIRNKVRAAMGDAEKAVLVDGSSFTWKTQVAHFKAREAYTQESRVLRRSKAKGGR